VAEANMSVYGVCAGIHPEFGNIAFITEDEGSKVQMWAFNFVESNFTLLKEFNISDATQSEGCVYDDENLTLFISEEQDRGILRAYKINKKLEFNNPIIIDTRQGNIVGDPEGITILKTSDKDGYVILSSQGNSKFNVYKRTSPHNFIKSFSIKGSGLVDEVNDTDGLDITNINLGASFPAGILVVQDGRNEDTSSNNTQNFKYISTKDVLKKINLK
jgi:myo-inositol-hexaphosphate 3-phosphohydrolase